MTTKRQRFYEEILWNILKHEDQVVIMIEPFRIKRSYKSQPKFYHWEGKMTDAKAIESKLLSFFGINNESPYRISIC